MVCPPFLHITFAGNALIYRPYKASEVMREALLASADIESTDIKGFNSHDAVAAVAGTDAGLCVMHMQEIFAGQYAKSP